MTLDEAAQILNVKRANLAEESELQKMLKVRNTHWTVQISLSP